jgi:hypothetical protein
MSKKGSAKAASLRFYHAHWPRGLMRRLFCHHGRILDPDSRTNAGASVRLPSESREGVHGAWYSSTFLVRRGIRASPP